MRLFRHFRGLPADMTGCAVAVGNFDGVHLGHREVIREAGQLARAEGIPWAVLTFEPHPRQVFHPDVEPFRLSPLPVKSRLIAATGADMLVVVPFDEDFAALSARDFVEQALVLGLKARHVVCGHDFAFGHGRRGTPELLLRLGDEFGFGFTCVAEVKGEDGEAYSSTRIRQFLREGRVGDAARLLGRPYQVEGEVIIGDQRGRQLGFPTANVELGETVRPTCGVYAVRVGVPGGHDGDDGDEDGRIWHDGVANIGRRPTVGGDAVRLEAHLFDFCGDLYGQDIAVRLMDFVRPEKRFDGLAALRAQIGEDCREARHRLALPQAAPEMRRAGQR